MKAIQGDLIEGWGIHIPIMVLGLGFIFSVLRKQSKQGRAALNVVSLLFALFTIFGQIYMEIGNWNEVFSDLIHFSIVLIWVVGYSIIYKKCILFIRWLPAQLPKNVWRRDCYSKLEKWLFETHPFMGTLVIVGILAIPWLVCFFPGTLEPDAPRCRRFYETLS